MALNDADLFLVNQGGVSKKITYENLKLNLVADEALWELDGTNIQPVDDDHDLVINGDVQMESLNGGPLAGFRNQIINGDFRINQRSGTRTPGVGVYGFDRWKGHANGLEQIIEALAAGEYTLSWTGGGNATFGGTTAVSPITATVAAGDTSVVVPQDATNVQLEPGPVATPFEHRPIGTELSLCQRYFQRMDGNYVAYQTSSVIGGTDNLVRSCIYPWHVKMRPSGSYTLEADATVNWDYIDTSQTNPEAISVTGRVTAGGAGAASYLQNPSMDVEL